MALPGKLALSFNDDTSFGPVSSDNSRREQTPRSYNFVVGRDNNASALAGASDPSIDRNNLAAYLPALIVGGAILVAGLILFRRD